MSDLLTIDDYNDLDGDVFPDFSNYSYETQNTLTSLVNILRTTSASIILPEFILSLIGIVLNMFHLIVLTRHSMRSSSTNVLMTGVALCDLFIMFFGIYTVLADYTKPNIDCLPPISYIRMILELWAVALRDDFRRVSAWIGVFMASFRFFIIKNSLKANSYKLSQPSSGWKIIVLLLLISSTISSFYWTRIQILDYDPWVPPEQCFGFPANYSEKQYLALFDADYFDDDLLASKICWFLDGSLRIIPAILLPALTFLLLRQINNADSRRTQISCRSSTNKKDHTTTLVILMTVTFIIAEGPLGVLYVIRGYVADKTGFLEITIHLASIMNIFVVLNATTHCLICWTMSTQYQKCVKSLICCRKKPKVTMVTVAHKISMITVRSTTTRMMTSAEKRQNKTYS